jgi:thiosulfate/3-mercaptopyruvate sulfurtransferase
VIDLADSPLVSPAWLAEHLGDPDLRIVDARWFGTQDSRRHYRAGHIPGAVPIDWQRDLAETRGGLRDLLLEPAAFAGLMGERGIGDRSRVVAYAHRDHSGAARLWWALKAMGHDQVGVLDGGLDRWRAEGRPLATDRPAWPRGAFTARPRPGWLATARDVALALGDPGARLVDARPAEQFAGQAVWTPAGSRFLPPGAAAVDTGGRAPTRAGRLPGAVHLPSTGCLHPADWTLRPQASLRALAESAGLSPDQQVITYCGVGISASMTLFALWLAGYRRLALYDASWEEWGTDPTTPIERPGLP